MALYFSITFASVVNIMLTLFFFDVYGRFLALTFILK